MHPRLRYLVVVAVAIAFVPGCQSGGSSAPTPPTASPSASGSPADPSPSPSPSNLPAIPDGTYEAMGVITRKVAIEECGLEGGDVNENLGQFRLELEAGAWTWTQDAPVPVKSPLFRGTYSGDATRIVLTVLSPGFFSGQRYTFDWVLEGDLLTFSNTRVIPPNPEAQKGVRCDYALNPWRLVSPAG